MPTAAQTDRFQLEIEGLTSELRVARFVGREGMSELFQLEIIVSCEDAAISAADVLGRKAHFWFNLEEDEPRHIHGIVARFLCGDAGKKLSSYHITVVPKAFRLLHRYDCRIFQQKTAPEIIDLVLKTAGLAKGTDYSLALQASYATREYCVQYRESDWAFVCRLMEEEGIYHLFEHDESGHTLVLGDKSTALSEIAGASTVVFRPPLAAMKSVEHVSRLHYAEQIRPGKVTLRDYDFKKPSLLLESEKAGDLDADLEVYDHPGNYEILSVGSALAGVRLEERGARRRVGDGDSVCKRFVPGRKFLLSDHGREAFDREWLITHVEHTGAEPTMGEDSSASLTPYENRFEVIPADVPFRPPALTPRPTIRGVQSAIVVGPSGEEIYTDEHGRVKVHFHWDREGKKDDKDSCWIRVSQVWAGEGWGAMHIPRIGQEVLVDFMDGDPDRPIIVGRVYHGTNVPPHALPANKTRSTIKSNSTPGGGGNNELYFEDKKGSEEIYLHGQKDWTILIENDKDQTVGHDETRKVGHDRTLEVGHDQRETITHDETFEVQNDRVKTVGHDETETIGNDRTISVGNDHTESVGNNVVISIGKSLTEEVGESSSETVGKAKTLAVGTDLGLEVTGDMTTKVASNQSETVDLNKEITVGKKLTITVGSAKVTIEESGDIAIEGANLTVTASGDVKVESGGNVEVSAGGDVKVSASGKVEVKSSATVDVSASGALQVKGASVGIN
ncbi:MAG: type VI secretion system tip protein TssI/VgrG [Polyangiaceae bacterium]